MLTEQELSVLRKKSEAATPGPWQKSYWDTVTASSTTISSRIEKEEDTDFIAAANPSTILKLLDIIEQLEKDVKFHKRLHAYPRCVFPEVYR